MHQESDVGSRLARVSIFQRMLHMHLQTGALQVGLAGRPAGGVGIHMNLLASRQKPAKGSEKLMGTTEKERGGVIQSHA
jgi:hypothetical protein